MKRLVRVLLSMILVCPFLPVHAEEDYSNTEYWNNLCTGSGALTASEKSACQGYMQHISSQTGELAEQLKNIQSQQEEIKKNIQYYAEQARGYQAQADALNGDIAKLNGEIAVLEKEIEQTQNTIESKQAEIEAAEEKIKKRMVSAQSTMRMNQFLDILMGARSFEDFVRIANGISDITNYDEKTMQNLADDIAELNAAKVKLEDDKQKLNDSKQEILNKQNEILALKYQVVLIENELQNQFVELEAQGNKVAANIDAIKETMRAIAEQLNAVTASDGWTYPVPGARISAGTWAYPSGGVHLGEDFAAGAGTNVYAVGNGVILYSTDGCGTGYLGNWCTGSPTGSAGGGNQVYLLTKINGNLYAVKYLHLLAGTPIAKGSIVMAGDYIGQVGSSGNSSGPHCHIEVFYLGTADNFANYAQNWSGDLSFGCGWSYAALNRKCENGVGAPCRARPESVFGG